MIVSTSIQENLRPQYSIQETYSSPLVNHTEPRKIDGTVYTRFYTKLNTELNVGDYVYILNGNYDNSDLIDENEYQSGSTGYKVLEVDRTSITLDILYRDENVWNDDPIEDYTKVYVVDNLDKFNYENTDNSFAFEAFAGVKFSDRNNNIFLSKIENLPYTVEDKTKNRFFKSYYEALPNIVLDNTRGQVFTDNTSLNYDLGEIEIYGADAVNGASGSNFMSFTTNYNYVKDFIIWDKKERTSNNDINSIITLNSINKFNSSNKIWTVDKRSLDNNSLSDVTVRNSNDNSNISVTNLNSFTNTEESSFKVKLPIFNNDSLRYYRNSSSPSSLQFLDIREYNVNNLNETIILSDRIADTNVNYRGFSFYNSKDDVSLQFISPDLGTASWPNLSSITKGYRENTNTETVPYFVLSARNGSLGNYTGDMVFPVSQNLSDVTANIIPSYGEYNGIGKGIRVESNRWFNQEEDSINLELAFAGGDTQTFDQLGGGLLPDREHGGIYFYSYSGTWIDINGDFNGGSFFGNAYDMSKITYDKFGPGGIWEGSVYSPFLELNLDSFNQIGDVSDIKWIGVEKKELGLRLSLNGSVVNYNPINEPLPSDKGIYYSKYLVTTKSQGGMGTPLKYYLYINLNGELLLNNPSFSAEVTEMGIPQAHLYIEEIEPAPSTIIGENRENDSYNFPSVLDGQYPIGNIFSESISEFGIPNDFTTDYDLTNTSVTDMTFHDFRWLVSSSEYSPRLDNSTLASGSEGIFLYDKSVDNRLSYTEIDTAYTFDIGDDLPSNSVFKIEGETMGDKRRVWVATDQGLFMFDYDFTYEYDYYYQIDVDNNEIPLIDDLYKNDKLYIIEDFEYDGQLFEKGKIYKHISNETRWVVDTTFEESYLSKANFKDGYFSSISKFNDGIYGSNDTDAIWENGTWRNGILFNSTWQSGTMLSKSDELLDRNYYTNISNGNVKISTDFENNNGYGYNLIKDSFIAESQVNNSVIETSIIGSQTSSSLLHATYSGSTYSYNDIEILNGYIVDSDIYSTEINNVKITKSNINSSLITGNSKLINNNVEDSVIDNAIMENNGDISIQGYDRWYNIKNEVDGQNVVHIHKFFINEEDFEKISYGDWITFNNVRLSRNSPSNILDKLYYILGGEEGFYKDIYEDLDRIKSNNSEYEENDIKVFISKKIATQNVEKTEINYNGTQLEITKVPYNNPMYSIDINIIIDKIPFNSSSDIYSNILVDDAKTKFTVAEITNSTIQNYHYKNTWINGGEWVNGSIITPDSLRSKYSYSNVTSDASDITFNKYNSEYEINPDIGNIVYVDNIWDTSFSTYSGGQFEVTNNATQSITLNPYGSFSSNSTLTTPLGQYVNLNLNRIDGINNTLIIKKGLFKNQSFSNLTIKNEDIDINNLDYYNIRNLMLINSEITSRDNVNISNLFFGYSYISNNFIEDRTNIKGLIYKSALYSVDLRDSYVTKSSFLKGRSFNSRFIGNKYTDKNSLIPINTNGYSVSNRSLIPVWHDGDFERGTFEDSIWLNGRYLSGRFFNGEFLGGTFYTGLFGDDSIKSSSNLFRKGLWKSGTFENGIFGDNSNRIGSTRNIYTSGNHILNANRYVKGGINIWESGNFNSGIFSSTNDYVSLWKNGKFNNGSIEDSVIWYDGIFNNGKFKSVYGRHLANVLGKVNYSVTPKNLSDEYNTSLSFLNRYNIASLRERNASVIDNVGTLVMDSTNRIIFIFVNTSSSFNSSIFANNNETAHGFNEKLVGEFYDDPNNTDLYVHFRPIDFANHPLKGSEVIGTKILLQETGDEYMYNGSSFVDKDTFLGTTMSGTSLTYSSDYAWRKGVFNGGEFGVDGNTNNANPSWEDGVFNGGDFYGKIWKNGKFVKGTFHGNGVDQFKLDNSFPFRGFDAQSTIDKYLDIHKTTIIGTASSNQIGYKVTLDDYKWYGLWLDGEVSSTVSDNQSTNTNVSPALHSLLGPNGSSSGSSAVSQNILLENFNEDKYNRRKQDIPIFKNMLWISGDFNNTNGSFEQSVWLAGTFSNGTFRNSMFNPYVMRWDFENAYFSDRKFKFELDNTKSIWLNGTFDGGIFYYSDWNNGTFEDGVMVGGNFKGGIANYISAYSSIWENGRFRNGNWYGSNFTIENIYNNNSIPNVFEYLGRYFENVEYPPFVTDILGNNTRRLQDDRLHIWNTMDGNIVRSIFNVNNYLFNEDYSNYYAELATPGLPGSGGGVTVYDKTYYLKDETAVPVGNAGLYDLRLGVLSNLGGEYNNTYETTLNVVSDNRYGPGIYEFSYRTSGTSNWRPDPNLVESLKIELRTDIYRDGFKQQSNVLLYEIPNGIYNSVKNTIIVPDGEEYLLKVKAICEFKIPGSDIEERILITVQEVDSDISYTSDNNTLNGYLQLNWSGDYLNSNINVTSSSATYSSKIDVTQDLDYETLDIVTISVPTNYQNISGAYTQYGNGSFQKGVFENGVWNNGYHGIDYGFYIDDSGDNFTYSSGMTANVMTNDLYTDNTKYMFRTEPIIYFNDVQRSFKVSNNVWNFVLESAFNVVGTVNDTYNKLVVGDQISISNIVAIDINGNRKLIKGVFNVIGTQDRNRIVVEYEETFPIDTIQIDSDRHLIYVTKNIWYNGAYLNGYFEGIMTNGLIRGNRYITQLENSHLIDVDFKGGHFKGVKEDLNIAFDNRTNVASALSPQFGQNYNNKFHTALVQKMDFEDDVTIKNFNMDTYAGVTVNGEDGEKTINVGPTSSISALQYIYNSDMDIVYEPEFFSSLFNQSIINSHVLGNSKIGSLPTFTNMFNIPAGYITYDILDSNSKFRYSTTPTTNNEIDYNLSLGSKYTIFNTIFDADFNESPDNDVEIDKPSTYNIVQSATYGVYNKEEIGDGIGYGVETSKDVHEDFMYIYATAGKNVNLIGGDNSFKQRDRYHLVEMDVQFPDGLSITNPYNIQENILISTSYSYGTQSLPKLSIGQSYNEFYENTEDGGETGYLSPYDNDTIGFFNGNKQSEINNFGTQIGRLTLKSFSFNNFGGYRNSVKILEKDFSLDGEAINGTQSYPNDIKSPIYHSLKHYEVDKIPFFNYKDYIDPITATVSEWNMLGNQKETRLIDNRIKVPFYATSIPINYQDSNFVLTDNINFLGGTNIDSSAIVEDLDILNEINNQGDGSLQDDFLGENFGSGTTI